MNALRSGTLGAAPVAYNAAVFILAVDTTNEHGGAGIFRDGDCLALAGNDGRANYSIRIFEMAERLLADTRLKFGEIDLYAVAHGPGSFTGIRVGVAAVQGWASAFSRPVCGVSALAALTVQAQPATEWAAAILDARRGEFYVGLFQRLQAAGTAPPTFRAQGEGWIAKPYHLAATLAEKIPRDTSLTLVVRDHDPSARGLAESLPGTFHRQVVEGLLVPAIARIALEANAQGRLQSPAELDACYIRRTDAELHLKE